MKRFVCMSVVLLSGACKNQFTAVEPPTPQNQGAPQPAAPTAVVAPQARVEGRIDVSPAMAAHVSPGDTIFLIARHSETNAMVAVVKLAAPARFPLPFGLGPENVMVTGAAFAGPLKITARVDKDGDATTKNPGDVLGEIDAAVAVPAKDVVLTLSHML